MNKATRKPLTARRPSRTLDELRWTRLSRKLYGRAARYSNERGLRIDVTPAYIENLFFEQEGRCALTGREFSLDWLDNSRSKPWAPSLDRIIPSRGYVRGNVRLISWAANRAMSDGGADFLLTLARDILRHHRKQRRQAGTAA